MYKKNESVFKNRSKLNVKKLNTGSQNIQSDFFRASNPEKNKPCHVLVNGTPLSDIAPNYNGFKTEEDVVNFFKKEVLKEFKGSENEKENAIKFLKKYFHQGCLLYPVSSAVTTDLKNKPENERPVCSPAGNEHMEKQILITPTNTGFKIKEICSVDKVVLFPKMEEMSKKETEDYLIKAQATVIIDFSKNSTNPNLTVKDNYLEISNKKLKNKLKNLFDKKESFLDRYGKSIIASTVAGAMTGASGGAIAGGVISALSAPVTGGLSLLGAPFLVGVGAAIGAGIGAITGLLTGIARSLYDNHKTKNNPQKLQKEADEFLADPEELLKPENEITDKNAKSYAEIIELSTNGDQRRINSLKKSKTKQSQFTHPDSSVKTLENRETKSFEGDESDSLGEDFEKDNFNSDRSNSFT